jgi:predicted RNase H-like HicB family nuclease
MLFIPTYIEKQLQKARYEYDPATKSWCAWVPALPGVYAQHDTVEGVREQLAEVIEDYIFVKLKKGRSLPQFRWPRKTQKAYA